jgi:hypothetical protein
MKEIADDSQVVLRGFAALLAVLIYFLRVDCVAEEMGSIDLPTITHQLSQQVEKVESLYLHYTIDVQNIVDEAVIFKLKGRLPPRLTEVELVCVKGSKLYLKKTETFQDLDSILPELIARHPKLEKNLDALYTDVPFAELKTLLAKAPKLTTQQTDIYDDGRLTRSQSQDRRRINKESQPIYVVVDTSKISGVYFVPTPIDKALFGPLIPTIAGLAADADYRAKHSAPKLFSLSGFRVLPKRETVGDAECLIVQGDTEVFWLDPKRGYAVTKRQLLNRDGGVRYETILQDFAEPISNVFFPKNIKTTEFGSVNEAGYNGKPLSSTTWIIDDVTANRSEHLSFFKGPPAGAFVMDQTLRRLNEKGEEVPLKPNKGAKTIPSVNYTQPASQNDLEETIRKAQLGQSQDGPNIPSPSFGRIAFFVANVALIGVLAFFLGRRYWRARASSGKR